MLLLGGTAGVLLFQNCSTNASGFETSLNSSTTATTSSYADPSALTLSATTVTEGADIVVTASLSFSSSTAQVFQYTTIDGTAIAGTNYTAASGTLTFAAGESTKTFYISTMNDGLAKGTLFLSLSFGQFDTGTNYKLLSLVINDAATTATSASARTLANGFYHSCGVSSTGALACWGYNGYGQLGNGSTSDAVYPQYVPGLSDSVTAVSAGAHHSCAIRAGTLYCWGYNGSGQLGNASTTNSSSAKQVSGLSYVTSVSSGAQFNCAIQAGAAYCWGYNGYGQIGNGTVTSSSTPQLVTYLSSGVTQISAGNSHACAIKDGGLYCWGYNASGQIGNGGSTSQVVPQLVSGMESGVTSVSAGLEHTCAVQNSLVRCWGSNSYGQLGDGTQYASLTPKSNSVSDAVEVTTALYTSCATTTSGGLKCWGYNGYGQVGASSTYGSLLSPNTVFSSGVTMASHGHGYHMCGTSNSVIYCWGYNYYGQLGNGSRTNSNVPTALHF